MTHSHFGTGPALLQLQRKRSHVDLEVAVGCTPSFYWQYLREQIDAVGAVVVVVVVAGNIGAVERTVAWAVRPQMSLLFSVDRLVSNGGKKVLVKVVLGV